MSIKIYNTLTIKKEEFRPIKKGHVGMYVCGVTVYDECHIGHVRGAFTFDVVRRFFEYKGYKVKYVRNITDVDDKIIEKARSEQQGRKEDERGIKEKVKEVAERYIKTYYEDMKALGIRKASIEPKATEHIKDMVEMIEVLLKKGYAYEENGDVYFKVRKFKDYGKLSRQSLDEMKSGARVEIDKNKKDPLDFVLWKRSKDIEPSWPSPWGEGRPGWHIECSSMSTIYLGDNFDIHGGGRDLVFPHHENEIAQSESATGKKFANFWMHNGLLTINGQKMSKSLGNFVSVKDILKRYHPEVLKIFFLSSHYRSPIDFTYEKMEEAKKAKERFGILFERLDRLEAQGSSLKAKKSLRPSAFSLQPDIDSFRKRFEEAMEDDFNTAEALATLFDLVTYINKKITENREQKTENIYARDMLIELGGVLGLFEKKEKVKMPFSKREIEELINKRDEARLKKDFKSADKIRERLNKMGIILEDQKDGTTWSFFKPWLTANLG